MTKFALIPTSQSGLTHTTLVTRLGDIFKFHFISIYSLFLFNYFHLIPNLFSNYFQLFSDYFHYFSFHFQFSSFHPHESQCDESLYSIETPPHPPPNINFVPCTSPWNNLQLCVVIWSLIALYFTHTFSLSLSSTYEGLGHFSSNCFIFHPIAFIIFIFPLVLFFVLGSPTSLYPCFPWVFPQCICALFFCWNFPQLCTYYSSFFFVLGFSHTTFLSINIWSFRFVNRSF